MANHLLEFELTAEGIEKGIKGLKDYQEYIGNKALEFVQRLADKGIMTAQSNLGNKYNNYIVFSKEVENPDNPDEKTCLMYMTNDGVFTAYWEDKNGGIVSADVSPVLMVEFGSGFRAKNPNAVPGVGQGTFPNQKHAFDRNGWWYKDTFGYWQHSYGEKPEMPLYKAKIDMANQIFMTAFEVFV